MLSSDILVIGGGAAGMMAAVYAAREGLRVMLVERNEKLGKKLYITGKGRCNVTNMAAPDDFMRSIVRNPRFLYASLAHLDNTQTVALFESLGVPIKVERGERAFPVSDKASDINRALERELTRLRVHVEYEARVKSIRIDDRRHASGALLEDGREVSAKAVILATGGLSYPSTGSTGDGHHIAKSLGHNLKEMLPSLVAIETEESWPHQLMGLTLKNVRLTAKNGKKPLFSDQGELLLTHFGISGPLVLTLSSLLPNPCKGFPLQIDLKPALDEQTLDARILREFAAAPNRQLIHALDTLAPHNLALKIAELAVVSPAMPIHQVTSANRRDLIQTLKHMPLHVKGLRGFAEAVVTRGGVDVRDINPSTLESKRVPGLYFAGELIDIDALTGGYNLQLAFSTGALAAISAAEAVK